MKIAQVSPLYESVPPKLYGGTERVVSYLTEELVRRGHDVTLFASGDSITSARLTASCEKSLRLNPDESEPLVPHFIQMKDVIDHYHEFDILHFHTDYLHFPVSSILKYDHLTTLHGRLDLPVLQPLYKKYSSLPLVSISNNQRKPLSGAHWIGTVYHGLPINLLREGPGNANYLAFCGRISPEKGVEEAIEIARLSGIRLRIAAKIDKHDSEYFEKNISHLFKDPLVEYIGEITEDEKQDFYGNALALLFPINWPEPFGLVMIEAMAAGTPVIAFRNGSVEEVIDAGLSGFIVSNTSEAVQAVARLNQLNRSKVRKIFESRFTAEIMAGNYLRLYHLQKTKSEKTKPDFISHHSSRSSF